MIVKNNKKIKEVILENGKREPLSRNDIVSTLDNIRNLISEFNLDKYYMLIVENDFNHPLDNVNIVFQMDSIIDKLKIIKDLFNNKLKELNNLGIKE